jgi:stage II sporulation protein D
MSANWPQEALKAQAVAARSYALYKRSTSGNSVYDVGDTTTWQVYKGLETEAPGTQSAVNATAGQVMTYGGKIILAVFHSSSGGHTENVEDIWTDPYLTCGVSLTTIWGHLSSSGQKAFPAVNSAA